MSDYYKLKEVCSIKGGKRIPQGYTLQEEPNSHPYIRILDMYQGRILELNDSMMYARMEYLDKIRRYIVNEGDIILAIVGNTLGMVSTIGKSLDKANLTENCCKFDNIDRSKVVPLFLYYSLISPLNQEQIEKFKVGSSQPKLPLYNVGQLLVPMIPLLKQEKITMILSAFDEKIEINLKICAELESMAKTLYDYWFVQFDFPNENGKPYRTAGGEMVWNDQLKREIPKEWEVGKIQQLGTIISGGTPSTKHEEYYCDCGFAWITPNDLSGNEGKMFIGHGERDVTQDGIDNSSATLMPKGSLLLSTRAPIGYLAIAENELCTNQGFKSIVPDAGYSEYYIYYLLQRNIPALEQQGTGTTFKEVSKDTLSNFSIVLPGKDIANEFANKIKSNCELRGKLEAENRELTKLRDWLLPMLMNGQATVE